MFCSPWRGPFEGNNTVEDFSVLAGSCLQAKESVGTFLAKHLLSTVLPRKVVTLSFLANVGR